MIKNLVKYYLYRFTEKLRIDINFNNHPKIKLTIK